MALRFLDFDYSEDDAGHGVFDAMASVWPEQLSALRAEIVQVLDWAHAQFGEPQAPVEDGGEWDYDLSGSDEVVTPQTLTFDVEAHQLRSTPTAAGRPRHALSLSLSGTPAFCEAFRETFLADA